MQSVPYILARTMKEAHAYARGPLGLAHGRYRIVNSPSTIKSVRGVKLYLVPGWQNRFDRFAMKGAIRWTRMEVIDVAALAEEPAAPVTPEPELESVTDQEATDFVLANLPAEQAEEPAKRTRRRRCSICGSLFNSEEIDEHVKTHEAA